MACCGQFLTQMPQPMQPFLQALTTAAPRSLLRQSTAGWGATGFIFSRPRGQALVQAVQPVHLVRSTTATPFCTLSAPNTQALTQSP